MKKIAIIFLIIFASSIMANYAYCKEDKEGQEKTKVDYMQKYYEKLAKEQEEQEKKVKEFEPTTPFGKFMGHFVSAFLIISLIIIIGGWLCVSMFAEEDAWSNLLKVYSAIASYFMINYAIWFALKLLKTKYIDMISISSMIITAILFFLGVFFAYQHRRDIEQSSRIPQWKCKNCNATNHYNDTCWNCNTAKPTSVKAS
jgi:hypothetical protein